MGFQSSPELLSFVSARPVDPAGSASREVGAPDPTTSRARLVDEDRPDPRPRRATFCRRVSYGLDSVACPLQSFPSPGSRARSRGPLLPCGFALRPSPARRRRFFTIAFPVAPALSSRDDGSSRSLVRSPRRTRRHAARSVHSLRTPGSPPTNGTPASKRCSPRGSVPPGPRLGRREPCGRCSPGVVALQSLLHQRSRARCVAQARARGSMPRHARLRAPDRRGCRPRSRHRPGAHEPWVRRRAPS